MVKMSTLCKRYRSEEIIGEAVRETLEFGHEHLIDKRYEEASQRSKGETLKYALILLMMFFSMVSLFSGGSKK